GVFDAHRGMLALFGEAPISAYIAALESVTYQLGAENSSGRTNTGLRVSVSDGQSDSKRVMKPISFSDLISGSFEIPTGFTPNGDAVNDTWSIRPLDNSQNYDGAIVRVYSKSGLLVFEGTGIATEWDGRFNGTLMPPDVYFYTVDFNAVNTKANLKGIVTLLR
ncbi:MAG TPA: gliding motility-associated C-terminal domain-containing protein, partial [Chryseosolibacter sp.]|nr:gliding motility-associated C-terminal domain-containing protein [Chryseosolibacter sp.]